MIGQDLAYTAGVVDGDGCITITKLKYGDNHCYRLVIAVAMKSPTVPNWLHSTFGGSLSNNGYPNQWSMQGKEAKELVSRIFPYLKEKGPQAALALAYPVGSRGHRLDAEQRAHQKVLYQAMKPLNGDKGG